MIIDGVSEGYSDLLDRGTDVMTSPVHLWSFYGCSSPTEPDLSAGSPKSDSDQSWSNSASESFRYQGVRVKNTVKELIMQKRHHEIQAPQYHTEVECPEITRVLQATKRCAENISQIPMKRAATNNTNILSPCSESLFSESEMLDDIGDVLSKDRLSIDSVIVRGFNSVPMCTSPEEHIPLQSHYTDVGKQMYSGVHQLQSVQDTFSFSALMPTLSATTAPPVSFFEWQIQQEEEKLAGLSHTELIARDGDGDTFLHIAVAQGRRALAYVLAKKMATIDMLDLKEHNRQSAFQVSIAANQHLIAQDLLSLGAEANTLDCWGRSPLHVCAEKGHNNTLQVIQKYMQTSGRHINMETVNYDGLTALHVAVLSHNAVVQELSCHVTPSSAHTVALVQRRKHLNECINMLLLMGASLETKDRKSGRTALHIAAEEANVELLRVFLDQSNYFSVINAKSFNGNTALHMASALQGRQTQADAVRLLLRRGADPSSKNLENEQPAQLVPDGPLGEQVRRILKGRGGHSRS
ncbi:NF-kappa-B inhibitor zeta isoform X2 [Xyrauchen texanus]|uniref:NF-kappa-B inhibitor zeta isoform X2 n=1 Tax=Xyrauchen texanus TaxID=154827 RepID=UPI00224229E0|nr:NF-kappa-B inhibitor zeta isoform X2 [Xyrauchen texanus]